MKLLQVVLFSFGFFVISHAKYTILKEYVIDLDTRANDRWKDVARDYGSMITEVLNGYSNEMNPAIFDMMTVLASSVAKEIPLEYLEELSGLAECINSTLGELILLNMMYEMTAYGGSDNKACTSIVATLANGHIIHGRNLDYGTPGLNHLVVALDFQKNGKTLYKAGNNICRLHWSIDGHETKRVHHIA